MAADLRVQFAKAADASDRAVMADTDEDSTAFAHEASATTKVVAADAQALAAHLQSLGFTNETLLLEEFSQHFGEYMKVDRGILELAVENTNLKAQRLAFGPIRETADSLRDSLTTISRNSRVKDRCRAEALATGALLAIREVQVLQAPHIAEPDDAAMDRIEKEMAGLQAKVRSALTTLGDLVNPGGTPGLVTARAAFARFESLGTELIKLSRRNSNVRSLALSLRKKPALTAACDTSLSALHDALGKQRGSATR